MVRADDRATIACLIGDVAKTLPNGSVHEALLRVEVAGKLFESVRIQKDDEGKTGKVERALGM